MRKVTYMLDPHIGKLFLCRQACKFGLIARQLIVGDLNKIACARNAICHAGLFFDKAFVPEKSKLQSHKVGIASKE